MSLVDEPSWLFPSLTIVISSLSWIAATKFRRGQVVSPFSVYLLVLLSIYGIRPLFLLQEDQYYFYGLSFRSGFNASAFVGFLAVFFGSVAYFWTREKEVGSSSQSSVSERASGSKITTPSLGLVAVLSLCFVASWFVMMALAGGGSNFVLQVFEGRNDATNRVLAGVPAFVGALPVSGAVAISAFRILIERERGITRSEAVLFWLVICAAIVPPLALGVRRYLLPSLMAAAIAATLRNLDRKVTGKAVLLGGAAFVALAIIPFIRSTGSRGTNDGIVSAGGGYLSDSGGLVGAIRPFFVSYDTEMFDYVAVISQRLGDSVAYGYGRGTVGDLLLNPLPASQLSAPLWSDQVLISIFGGGCAQLYCPVPSFAGVFYYDIGLLGVILAALLAGWLSRKHSTAMRTLSGFRLTAVLTVAAFTPVLVRGNVVNVFYICALTAAMAVAIHAMAIWAPQRRVIRVP